MLLFLGVFLILCSMAFRYIVLWDDGLTITPDSIIYIRGALSLSQGATLLPQYDYYEPVQEEVLTDIVTHYPPITAVVYSLPITLGVDPAVSPSLVSLLFWALLLSGMGLLAYKLSQSPTTGLITVALAALSYPFLWTFNHVWSELIFLPLLVYSALIFSYLPQQQKNRTLYLSVGSVLLGILMLTRYVGVFFYATVIVWWLSWRFREERAVLVREMFILFLAGVPFLGWMVQSIIATEQIGGFSHLSDTEHSFQDGIQAVLDVFPWIVSPAADLGYRLDNLGLGGWRFFVLVTLFSIGLGAMLWYRQSYSSKAIQDNSVNFFWSTPIPLWIMTYLAVFTIAQPFFLFYPMDVRFLTAILCILHPWSLALFSKVAKRALWALVIIYLLAFASWNTYNDTPIYIAPWYPRTNDLINQHPETAAFMESLEPPLAIVTNVGYIFASHPELGVANPLSRSVISWLEGGRCFSEKPVVVVLLETDQSIAIGDIGDVGAYQRQIEEKCSDVEATVLADGVVYALPTSDE